MYMEQSCRRALSPKVIVLSGSMPGRFAREWDAELLFVMPDNAALARDKELGAWA